MAIYNGRILMRKGNEADFDASKLMSGEWAVSLDKGIVRICLEPGMVIRMATYEAFEEDMKQIEAILLECQTIEEAVQRINAEINAKVDAVVEYVGQAKTYRDEALQFRNEAESFKNQAGEIAGIDIATNEKAGIVKPDGTSITVDADGTIHSNGGSGGTSNYNDLTNKPKINGVELVGDVSTDDLNINLGASDYVDLTNKPSINGVELSGNLTDADLNIQGVTDYKQLTNKPSINGTELNGNLTLDTGTDNYAELKNKPTINGVEVNGDLTSADLKLDSSGIVVDNLLSTSTTLPLSANQGRVLDEKIGTINESLVKIYAISKTEEVAGKGSKWSTFDISNLNANKIYAVTFTTNSSWAIGNVTDIKDDSISVCFYNMYSSDVSVTFGIRVAYI